MSTVSAMIAAVQWRAVTAAVVANVPVTVAAAKRAVAVPVVAAAMLHHAVKRVAEGSF